MSPLPSPRKSKGSVLRRAIGRMHPGGLTGGDDPERRAQSLWAGLRGLFCLLIARPQFPSGECASQIDAHARMLARAALRS